MKREDFLVIENKGQVLAKTNYFDSEPAARGFFFLSWNAGAGRLLVPDSQKPSLRDMRSAKYVIVSSGPWQEHGAVPAYEQLFEDHSDAPFAVTIPHYQSDRTLPSRDEGGGFFITIWTRDGLKGRLPGRYRQVAAIPCLEEWRSCTK
jgi:hypothetical protein